MGRGAECEVCIPAKSLSRAHAVLMVDGGTHFIQDLGSRNKTYRGNVSNCRPQVMGSLNGMGTLWGPIPAIDTIVTTTLCPGFPAQILSRNFGENSENLAHEMMPLEALVRLCGDPDHTVLAHRVLLTGSNHGYSTCSLVSLKSINYLLCIGKLVVMAMLSLLPVVLVQGVLQ